MKYVTEPNYFTIVKFHEGEVLQFSWTTRSFPYNVQIYILYNRYLISKQC